MRHFLPLLLILCAGCCWPFKVETHNRVEPIEGQLGLELSSSIPSAKGGRVVSMPVDGSCDAAKGTIAILDVDGLLINQNLNGLMNIGDNPVAIFKEKLDAVREDNSVRAVVVRINSPGGGVTACDMMRRELIRFKETTSKPVVACILDVGAGGAYYLASAADQVIAHPTSLVGGIGVIWNSYNFRDLLALFSVIPQPIKSGQNIDLGSTTRALSADQKKLLQLMADEFHDRFKDAIRQRRPGVRDETSTFDGQIFTASDASKRGLIDNIGYLEDALDSARSLSRSPGAGAVMFHRKNDPAYSPYSVSGHLTTSPPLIPLQIPGFDRSRLPTFLYLWQPDAIIDNH